VVTWLGSSVVIAPMLVLVGSYFLVRSRNWRPGVHLLTAYAGALVLYSIIKPAVGRPRPPVAPMLVHVSGFAFPSGHATMSVAFYGTLAGLLWNGRSRVARFVLWLGASIVVLLIGTSRLYLGAHWFTDVLGGYALGGLWLSVLVAAVLVTAGRRSGTREPTTPPPELARR
jgi:membrane-associated phospholipid phosphatase